MRRLVLLAGLLTAVPLLVAAAPGPTTTVERVPLQRTVFVACANGGLGDTIDLDGWLHTVFTTAARGDTTFVRELFNPMGVRGVGRDTGTVYRGAGATSSLELTAPAGGGMTAVNNFLVIGPGPGNNLEIHTVLALAIDGDGVVDVLVDRVAIDCR